MRTDVIIIGAGFGGLAMAIALKKAGFQDFLILEQGQSAGGTWRDNQYPGAACDVESHLYSLSAAPNTHWSRKFGAQAEIKNYIDNCVKEQGLANHIRYGVTVSDATFNDNSELWNVACESGEMFTSQVLVSACGQLNRPAYPKLKGLERFKGQVFHSARWDHTFDLTGKRVAVIGTGASAIQFVPEIVDKVASLTLFQRTAAWVISKGDRPFNLAEKWAFKNLPLLDNAYRGLIYWKNEFRALGFTQFSKALEVFALEAKYMAKRDIKDPEKRKKAIPDYKIGCKRILISNEWYKALNKSNLDLVSTGISNISENAVHTTDGVEHEVDAIIFGTGFSSTEFLSPMKIHGRNGLDLNEAWKEGAHAYKGITVSGFPNFFMLYGPNTNLAHSSIIFMLECQVRYVMDAVKWLKQSRARSIDVKPEALSAFDIRTQKKLEGTVWQSGCKSWYITESGRNVSNWPGFTFTYRWLTRKVEKSDYTVR
ncbi:MAG: NAD(P)/FAD-dependent oxidoreductase [Burkholderiales bacterium]|jgi:cation diffusion facilitator CzcD-associated flavoprotein CzcO|nr:NAD(P)/FAD-dependent oxidoreductase [Burkholderiales bacterium]